MDQQDNAYPGATGGTGQGRPADDGREQKDKPAPVWGGVPAGHASRAYEPVGQDQSPEERAAHGWGAPAPGAPSTGWGTTPAAGHADNAASGWGAPQHYAPDASPRPGKGSWTGKKSLLVGGVAVVVGAAAGAGAYAASNGTTAASSVNGQGTGSAGQFGPGGQSGMTGQGGMMGPGGQSFVDGSGVAGGMNGGMGMDGGPGGLGMGAAGLNAAVHSEYVVLQGSSYVTMAGQAGTVTEISGTSMTVKSEDGFSRTYAVGSDVKVAQGMRQRGSASTGSTLSFSNVATGASVRVTALKDGDTYTAETILLAASSTSTAPSSGTSSN